jgi:hypothetical protein
MMTCPKCGAVKELCGCGMSEVAQEEADKSKEDGGDARWRVGRKLGRTLYLDGKIVGMMDTRELAAWIVKVMNGEDERARGGR